MKFGIFDHMDRGARPLHEQYADRLKLIEAYDRAGFHAYHLAEHHATPLGMAPSPSVFLAAVAQHTKRLRFGPLVYTLPLHHPLRVFEEICMLDHLSGGRLELGLGRGAVPYEIEYYGVAPAEAQARYFEVYAILMQAMTSPKLTFEGKFYRFKDVPLEFGPLQKPHPPIWYGVSNAEAAVWAAQNAVNVVCNGPVDMVRGMTTRYRAEWNAAGRADADMPFLAMNRHLVIAETDAAAMDIARRAYLVWHASFFQIWRRYGTLPANATAIYPETFDELMRRGYGVAGTAMTVRDVLRAHVADTCATYVMGRFSFGDLTLAESLRTVEAYAADVMPALAETREAAE
jgi:alkanesulfonate monooxygenase SsuD/methylene tetrahydromethanopterin reductase-like flavin-dependent oxidoreductase (luciferase family)